MDNVILSVAVLLDFHRRCQEQQLLETYGLPASIDKYWITRNDRFQQRHLIIGAYLKETYNLNYSPDLKRLIGKQYNKTWTGNERAVDLTSFCTKSGSKKRRSDLDMSIEYAADCSNCDELKEGNSRLKEENKRLKQLFE